MRIVKLKANGDVGAVLLGCSNIRSRPTFSDEYVIAFDAEGLDEKGDAIAYRLALSRNELRAISEGAIPPMPVAD